jgi:alkanesulfonate monooxygenase SsuD/methylene tetrahydromethanopterin reductase-like flavin-dependent oxidoreductase (luciferase family)
MEYVVEHADLGAVGHLAALHARDAALRTDTEGINRRMGEGPIERQVIARGSYCAIGDPDHVASELMRLHAAGFDGLALNFVDYLDELPFFAQEVLPRLAG